MRSIFSFFFSILFSLILTQPSHAKDKPLVFVSILPQKYFVEQIGKDLVDVEVMVLPGANPAIYEPKPVQMTAISKANVYFSIGMPFENVWLKKISSANPNMTVVPTDHGTKKLPMTSHHHNDEKENHKETTHRAMGSDRHNGLDPHIWLSPPMVMMQARMILTALQEIDPVHRPSYEANYQAFIIEILKLDAKLRRIFIDRQGLKFMVFHPSWGYFAHTYGLEQIPIEIEGKEPKPAQLAKLIKHARKENIKAIFVQPQFSTKHASQIAKAINGKVIVTDPLAANWPENLSFVASQINESMK
jgi:zinc transport system substrate-binding protein